MLDAKINRAFQFWFTDAKIFSCTCFSRTCAICNSLLYFSILYSLLCISLFCIVLGPHLLGVAVCTFWAYRSAPFGRSGRHLLGVPYALFGRTAPLFLGVPLCRFSAKWPKKKRRPFGQRFVLVSISTNLLPNLALHSPSQRESNRTLVRASRIFF